MILHYYFFLLVSYMHESYYATAFDYFLLHRLGIGWEIESDLRGRGVAI